MKVVIANPPWPGEGYGARSNTRWPHRRGDKKLVFPIYLAYTVALLKKNGFQARGIDAVWKEWDIEKFVDEVKKTNPDIILMETSTPSIEFDMKTARKLREALPGMMIVICGPHVTYFHREVMDDNGFIDVIIRGEFEFAFSDLCMALKNKRPLSSVSGITYRDGSKVKVNADRPLHGNLDDLPYPDREDFPIERYQQAFYCGKKTALLLSSRGCPFQCTYCLWPSTLTHRKYRIRDPKKVVDEIQYLIREEGIDEVFFDDDEFIVSRKKVTDFCDEMIARGVNIRWHCMGRVDIVDRELLSLMKKAGCYQIFYGFESGSEKILRHVKKGITKEQTKRAVKLTKEAGIVCGGSFILGTPEEDWGTFRETTRFAASIGADWVQFALCAPFPGTPMYEEVKNEGLLEASSWSDFDGTKGPIIRTKHLTRKELTGIVRKAYIAYYTSPNVIFTNIRSIRSWSQARRVLRGVKSVLSRIFYYSK